jgi:hypothetical protein
MEAQRRYLDIVLRSFGPDGPASPATLLSLGRDARLAYGDAQAAVGRSLAEPATRQIDPVVSQGVLVGLRRLIRAAHGLRAEVARTPTLAAVADLAPTVARACGQVEDGLAHGLALQHLPPLRAAYLELTDGTEPVPLPVAIHLDELIDAIDTVGQLMGAGDPAGAG